MKHKSQVHRTSEAVGAQVDREATHRNRFGFVAGGVVTGLVLSVISAVAAIGGPNPASCSGSVVVGPGAAAANNREAHTILSEGPITQRTFALPAPGLSPRGYAVNVVSWDGYVGRDTASQPAEVWFVELLDSASNVLARTSRTTEDIADNIEEATWAGGLGTVSWAGADAASVRVRHGGIGAPSPNSVVPICVGLAAIVQPTTPSSTAPVESQIVTTTPPSSTAPGSTTPSATVASTTAPPSSTAPVEVLGVVIVRPPEAQTAAPQAAQPRFAG